MATLLPDRKIQAVSVSGHLSEPSEVKSGVPQGPVLFITMVVTDIDKGLQHSTATSFTDNTRIHRHIEAEEDVALLQEDLDSLLEWSRHNNMQLSEEKFELLRYGQQQHVKTNTTYKASQSPGHSANQLRL